jgi:hypothetical protein
MFGRAAQPSANSHPSKLRADLPDARIVGFTEARANVVSSLILHAAAHLFRDRRAAGLAEASGVEHTIGGALASLALNNTLAISSLSSFRPLPRADRAPSYFAPDALNKRAKPICIRVVWQTPGSRSMEIA